MKLLNPHQKFPSKNFPPKFSLQKFPAKNFPPKISLQKFPAKNFPPPKIFLHQKFSSNIFLLSPRHEEDKKGAEIPALYLLECIKTLLTCLSQPETLAHLHKPSDTSLTSAPGVSVYVYLCVCVYIYTHIHIYSLFINISVSSVFQHNFQSCY